MSNDLQTMDVLKQALVQQNQHGEALVAVIERMEEQEKRVDVKIKEVVDLVEVVSNKVHLEDKEAFDIQSAVNRKATEFAKNYLINKGFESPFGTNLFLSKIGQMRRAVYKRLRQKFNVTKYTHLKHVDFEEAMKFIESIEYGWLTDSETRWTITQKKMLGLY